MDSQKFFDLLIQDYGRLIGMDDLRPDEDHCCQLRIDEAFEFQIAWQEENGAVVLLGEVGIHGEADAGRVFAMLADANLLWRGTNGATLGADPESRMVLACERRPLAGLEVQEFRSWIEGFLDVVRHWREQLGATEENKDGAGSEGLAGGVEQQYRA